MVPLDSVEYAGRRVCCARLCRMMRPPHSFALASLALTLSYATNAVRYNRCCKNAKHQIRRIVDFDPPFILEMSFRSLHPSSLLPHSGDLRLSQVKEAMSLRRYCSSPCRQVCSWGKAGFRVSRQAYHRVPFWDCPPGWTFLLSPILGCRCRRSTCLWMLHQWPYQPLMVAVVGALVSSLRQHVPKDFQHVLVDSMCRALVAFRSRS